MWVTTHADNAIICPTQATQALVLSPDPTLSPGARRAQAGRETTQTWTKLHTQTMS